MLDGSAKSAASRIVGVDPVVNPSADTAATPSG